MLVGALRAADRRPTQFCAPSIFLRPCFRRPKANRRFTAQKQASPTELPRQVFCKPEQHSPLLPFCLPAVQKSLSLLSIINFYPHASCPRLSHPFFGPAQIVGMPLFWNPVRIKFPAGTVPYPDYFNELYPNLSDRDCRLPIFGTCPNRQYVRFFGAMHGQSFPQEQFPILIILMSFFPNLSVRSRRTAFRDLPESSACRFFGILFGQSFPLRRFTHCGTADRRATNVPRRILQTMFRSVTIFMRSTTVSGDSPFA